MEKCYFTKVNKCVGDEATELVNAGPQRVQTIINCSRKYDANLYHELEAYIDSEFSTFTHISCVSTYTSRTHINRFLKRKGDAIDCTGASPMKRRRRSGTPKFSFQTHCLFCRELLELKKDPKHPDRWRKAYLCRSVGEGDIAAPKQVILNKCQESGDKWSEEIKLRIHGIVSDLRAADARYHVDCKGKFMSPKNV